MKSIYLISTVFLASCSVYPPPFTERPMPPHVDQNYNYTKTDGLRLLEQLYAFLTIDSDESERKDIGNAGTGRWCANVVNAGFYKLSQTEQQEFMELLVDRYGLSSTFINITVDGQYFNSTYEWAEFIKNNENKMTPAADYIYRKYYIQRIEEYLKEKHSS